MIIPSQVTKTNGIQMFADTCVESLNDCNLSMLEFMLTGCNGSLLKTSYNSCCAVLQCVTCNLCGCGPVLDAIFAVVGAAWWAAAAVTWTLYFNQPNIARLPLANYRFAIFVLSWAACGLFVLLLLVSLFRMIAICCGCCGAEKRGHNYRDEEMGTGSTGCCGKRRARRSTTPADKVYVNPPQRQYITSDDAPGYQPGVQPVAAPGGRRFM